MTAQQARDFERESQEMFSSMNARITKVED
jgi:hypothetical protein